MKRIDQPTPANCASCQFKRNIAIILGARVAMISNNSARRIRSYRRQSLHVHLRPSTTKAPPTEQRQFRKGIPEEDVRTYARAIPRRIFAGGSGCGRS